MLRHIEHLRNKPEHVRKSIALGSAAVFTAVLALGWLAATVSGGTLALKSIPLDGGAVSAVATSVSDTSSSFSKLLSAAGAAGSATTSAPQLQIVDGAQSSTLDATTSAAVSGSQTVIPF